MEFDSRPPNTVSVKKSVERMSEAPSSSESNSLHMHQVLFAIHHCIVNETWMLDEREDSLTPQELWLNEWSLIVDLPTRL